jgi:2'-5' RNA ligase
MRLFTGLALPPDAAEPLLALHRYADLRWIPPEKLHITAKFIGEWPEDRLGELQRALASIRARPFEVHIRGLDWLPTALCAGVEASPPLLALAAATDAALDPLGIVRETRAYRPHVTLARVRRRTHIKAPDFIVRFEARSFHLYLSSSGKYTSLKEFPLASE